MITVLIVDDHPLFRTGLSALLSTVSRAPLWPGEPTRVR
jgi:DNA-binding NarL/FixJ family response regulator